VRKRGFPSKIFGEKLFGMKPHKRGGMSWIEWKYFYCMCAPWIYFLYSIAFRACFIWFMWDLGERERKLFLWKILKKIKKFFQFFIFNGILNFKDFIKKTFFKFLNFQKFNFKKSENFKFQKSVKKVPKIHLKFSPQILTPFQQLTEKNCNLHVDIQFWEKIKCTHITSRSALNTFTDKKLNKSSKRGAESARN
jgi:hypothetical protein